MESGITFLFDMQRHRHPAKGGFVLVAVLVITAIGLLFGVGSLLLFRYQCQMRIDRQHELEKVYAVRSALNFIRPFTGEIPPEGRPFRYYTKSERDLGLLVKPVASIFPVMEIANHFVMQSNERYFKPSLPTQYNGDYDYEYGAVSNGVFISAQISGTRKNGPEHGLAFTNLSAKSDSDMVKWWVNIGMRGTGGWLQEDYGRRYFFRPKHVVSGNRVTDIMRLCIIRSVTNLNNPVGCRYGWPLSKEGERALVFQIGSVDGGGMSVSEYEYSGGGIIEKKLISEDVSLSGCYMGLQIANNMVCMFYIPAEGTLYDSTRGYIFSQTTQMSNDTYKYFADSVNVGGKDYGGIYTNEVDGSVHAPELRAVFEVQASSDKRTKTSSPDASEENFLTDFIVTPAYQYDVFLEHPPSVTNKATVAQKTGKYTRGGLAYKLLTYDTHGTDHKGFRQDEREYERRKGN